MPRYPPGMLGSIISVIVTAFFTGALARFAVPGPDPMPAWLTILIGLVGTLIGGGDRPRRRRQGPGVGRHRRLHRLDRARDRLPPLRAEARPLGAGRVSLPGARRRRRGVPRAAPARRHRPGGDRLADGRRSSSSRPRGPARRRRPRAGGRPGRTRPRTRRTTCSLLEELHDNGVLERRGVHRVAHAFARAPPRVGAPQWDSASSSISPSSASSSARSPGSRCPGPTRWASSPTIGLGLAGAFIGGIVAHLLSAPRGGVIFSVLGAILLLYLYRRFVQQRPLTGPGARRAL